MGNAKTESYHHLISILLLLYLPIILRFLSKITPSHLRKNNFLVELSRISNRFSCSSLELKEVKSENARVLFNFTNLAFLIKETMVQHSQQNMLMQNIMTL